MTDRDDQVDDTQKGEVGVEIQASPRPANTHTGAVGVPPAK